MHVANGLPVDSNLTPVLLSNFQWAELSIIRSESSSQE